MFKKILENVPGTAASLARQLKEGPRFVFSELGERPGIELQRTVVDSLHYDRPFGFSFPPNVDRVAIAKIKDALDAHFDGLMTNHRIEGFKIDLRRIKGVLNAHPTDACTLLDYGTGPDCAHLPRSTDEDFEKLLASSVDLSPAHIFYHSAWEQDFYWQNERKAQYIAAAQAQAFEQGRTCMVNGVVIELRLNHLKVNALTNKVAMLMVPHTTFFGDDKIFRTLVEKHEVPVAWLTGNVWRPGATMVVLPKDNEKALTATEALISLGAIDINSELHSALANQRYVTMPNAEMHYKKPSATPGF